MSNRFSVTYKIVTPRTRIFHRAGIVCIEALDEKDGKEKAEKFLGGGHSEGIEILSIKASKP